MFDSTRFDSLKPILVSLLAATALAACGDNAASTSGGATTTAQAASEYLIEGDHVMGSADAPVTFVEYASVSCGGCANWHNTVFEEFKAKYVDTGKVRYVFREFLASDPTMADAGFMIALCAPEENYFKNIGLQFKRQDQIFKMAQQGKLREAYIGLAKASGLTEEDFVTCMSNQELRDKYMATMQTGIDMGVQSTPNFVVNGKLTKKAPSGETFYTLETIEEVILPLLGEPVPAKEKAE